MNFWRCAVHPCTSAPDAARPSGDRLEWRHPTNGMDSMLWLKALHIIFMVTWFAGLFYLPRLFVYHALSADHASIERFKIMERKLFIITTLGAVLTILFGSWLWLGYGFRGTWLMLKLTLVLILIVYHLYCGVLLMAFKHDRNRHGHVFYRWFNEFPVLILIAVVLLVVLKPF
jgi:protoporphyrinogen IX oxidase